MWFDEVKKLEKQLKIIRQKIKDNNNYLLEISAEFEDYKKRSAREMNDVKKFSNESLIKELLFITDNLELCLNATRKVLDSSQKANTGLTEGVDMTLKGLLKTLTKFKG